MSRLLQFTCGLIMVWIIGYFLIVGSSIIIPLVIAVFIWNILNTIKNIIKQTPWVGALLPDWLNMILALGVVIICILVFVDILSTNVTGVIEASGRYQDNLMKIVDNIEQKYHIQILVYINNVTKMLNIQTILVSIYGMFTSLASSTVLILLYVVFLFIEQHFLLKKVDAFFPALEDRLLVNNIVTHIANDTQSYLGIKFFLSLSTSISSWIVMKWVGLDFSELWALLIFFLNFIPNIGAIVAILFPAVLAIVQFTTWIPFIEILLGLGVIQFIIGNLIEPRFLSSSLNLSLLVILFSLTLWGAIWGVLGMFLSVPITVMMMIIFAHFDRTRPIAVLLSQDGDVFKTYEILPVENPPEKDWLQF